MSIKKKQYRNQFVDSFKYLKDAAMSVKDLAVKTNNALTRSLPARILSKANIFNTTIDVSRDLSQMVLLHVEDSVIENNMLIAQKEISIRGLASLAGHTATRPISAKGVLKLNFGYQAKVLTPIMVFSGTEIVCDTTGVKYTIVDSMLNISTSSTNTLINVIEGTWETEKIIAEGLANEKIELDSVNPIEESNIKVYVNNELWKRYDSLYDMGTVSNGYLLKNGIGNQVDVCFGNGRNGVRLSEGDIIDVFYLTSSGETGNISFNNPKFSITSGVYDVSGNELSVNDMLSIEMHSGFNLGSNGEHIEVTRNIAGYNSRAMVFTKPENVQAYLSRLSVLSHIDAWAEEDSNVFHMILAPNIYKKLTTYSSYLNLSEEDLKLTTEQKASVMEYLNESGSQSTSTEIILHDANISKYAMFCYVSGIVVDKTALKEKIENAICKVFLENTYLDVDLSGNDIITKSDIQNEILNATDLTEVNINIFSEENETSRINGFYNLISSSRKLVNDKRLLKQYDFQLEEGLLRQSPLSTKIRLQQSYNPNLGFNELGSIQVSTRENLPVLKGNFLKYDENGNHFMLDKPIYIFHKTDNGFEEL